MSTNFEDLILRDETANRPAAGKPGRLFYDTDEEKWQRDNGSTWDDCEPAAGATNTFSTIAVSGQSDVVADSAADTLTLAAGTGVTITTNAGTDTITVAATGASADHAAYTYLASMLEPLAIEALQSGAFSYAVAGGATKLVLNAYNTRLGASGRWEVRDPRYPAPLRGVTLTGLSSDSSGVVIDPAAPTYADARDTYFDRLQTIFETAPLYIDLAATGTFYTLLPGPYGSIITSVNIFDLTWIIARAIGTTIAWNLSDEIGDTGSSDYMRVAHGVYIPISKNVLSGIKTGGERTGGVGKGSVTYFNCASTWGKVTDSTSYDFRDDFMGASLDTATKWNRTQSSAGNMEIQTAAGVANWCKVLGNASWGANTITSQASVSRASGKVFMCDVFPAAESGGAFANVMVGWYDGAGTSYTDLAHAIDFTGAAGPVYQLQVFEASVSRGVVGTGYTPGCIYRVKITLDSAGANTAKYEIQGGPEYAALGGATWTDITPGTTSNSTTPLYAGIVVLTALASYVGDVKVY